ncbi:diacylglycerol acyltransferase-domain-containing protein [Mycena belliarum]|uniref:diacylglycerol O-acyltransferase n=1 Tax=Mycena belliarum TaxID=1033014 RepID=A0AAD6TW65_9AGAR|nr:diacylglycerol acyltransferase-domain-containing protein [Mycena belliae]
MSMRLTNALSASSLRERLSMLTTRRWSPSPLSFKQTSSRFVPAKVPRKRRLQMLAVAIWSVGIILATASFLLLWFFPTHRYGCSWVYTIYGRGGSTEVRSMYFADYYPASFRKARLVPWFGVFAHGECRRQTSLRIDHTCLGITLTVTVIVNRGALATFATEATGFSAAFPGIKPYLLTLTSNFSIPFYRDIILAMSTCSVSKKLCSNILRAGPGSAITIVVGGAAESLSARPGTADLTLQRCADLVPRPQMFSQNLAHPGGFGNNFKFLEG